MRQFGMHPKKENDEALEYYNKAITIRGVTDGLDHPVVANTYRNIGNVYEDKKDYEEAELYLKKTLNIRLSKIGETHPLIANTYGGLGNLSNKRHNFIKAQEYFKKTLEIIQYNVNKPTDFSTVLDLLELRTIFFYQKENYKYRFQQSRQTFIIDSLKSHYQTMLAFEDYIQKEYSGCSTRQFYAAESIPIYEGAISNLLTINNPKELSETFRLSEKTKSRFLSEKIQTESYTTTFGLPDTLREKEHDLNVDIAYYEKKKFQEEYESKETNDSLVGVYQDKLFDLKNERDELLELFKKDYSDYYDLRYSQKVISVKGVQDTLLENPNQVLLEYFVGDSSIFIFLITKDTFHIQEIKKDFPLKDWVKEMRCGLFPANIRDTSECGILDKETAKAQYADRAHSIYQKIFKPVETHLNTV